MSDGIKGTRPAMKITIYPPEDCVDMDVVLPKIIGGDLPTPDECVDIIDECGGLVPENDDE